MEKYLSEPAGKIYGGLQHGEGRDQRPPRAKARARSWFWSSSQKFKYQIKRIQVNQEIQQEPMAQIWALPFHHICLKIWNYRCLKVLVADAAVFVNIHLLQSHINQVLTKISIKSCTTRKSSGLQSCGWLSRRTMKLIESSNYVSNITCIQYYMDAENDKVGTNG